MQASCCPSASRTMKQLGVTSADQGGGKRPCGVSHYCLFLAAAGGAGRSMAEHLNTRIGCYSKILITHALQANRTSIAFNEKFGETTQRVFWQGHYVSYRRKVKNGDSEHEAHNNVEHIFGDDFEHSLPPIQVRERSSLAKIRLVAQYVAIMFFRHFVGDACSTRA